MKTGKINCTHVGIFRQLSATLMEPPVTLPHPTHFILDNFAIDRCISVEGCLCSQISHTPSELLPPESSVSDEELDGELLDTLAISLCRRFTP